MVVILFYVSTACNTKTNDEKSVKTMEDIVRDVHSFSQPNEAVVRHMNLDLYVDFVQKQISGTAELEFDKIPNAQKIVLDTKNLQIESITYANGENATYELLKEDLVLGSPLEIKINDSTDKIIIKYTTGRGAEALQWLIPSQTADKTDPFLFTQSQAILARSWIPLQDSPGIRFTYAARVTVPKGLTALMSAENPQRASEDGIYHFKMDQPIPGYLMALAVGKIDFAPIGKRTGVYAEPSVLKKARKEFNEMEDMLVIAEKLYGEYRWGRYDLIVLPPSFPFGGMENPRITFATPTILAGDKSLTSLVAHELAHSWSGNLVTNATWNDFWLNEGFTVYFETRIMEALKGKDYADMLSALSQQELMEEVADFMENEQEADTKLKLNLVGRNPDDGVTSIAYDKGYFFLKYLEAYVGREKFDAFLKEYFSGFAFASNDTEAFLVYLNKNLFQKNGLKPITDLSEWVYGTGLPESMPKVHSTRFDAVDRALLKWEKGDLQFPTETWSSHEWVHFIKNLPDEMDQKSMEQLDKKFDFTHSGNAEILGVWYVHCARHLYKTSFAPMEEFLVNTGRRKFLMSIYKELSATEKGKALALSIYQKARSNYHFVAINSLDKLLYSR